MNHFGDDFPQFRNPLAELFQALREGPDYSVQIMKTQIMVRFRGEKVGGLNHILWHFYISKVFVRGHGTPELLKSYGFEWISHNETHQYWKLEGVEHHQSFKGAIEAMTGCSVM
ncbi:hypothetical protein [Actibacterium pelagium]|uniref:Uncharacterized protein n=1 Tax=Actibacterium pelagium TaxID=2029103 RepID=A0A917AJS5_9RHOB|nr:hypothetical protein [Actibacterium pelagium]GGE55789.1 hypothetical protein GCM10011517_24290 [Actibacterium pelagium]